MMCGVRNASMSRDTRFFSSFHIVAKLPITMSCYLSRLYKLVILSTFRANQDCESVKSIPGKTTSHSFSRVLFYFHLSDVFKLKRTEG